MKQKILSFLLLFVIAYSPVFAQETEQKQDIVYLKDGSVMRGKIIDFEENKALKMEVRGEELSFKITEIEKIVQAEDNLALEKDKPKPKPVLKNEGIYNVTYLTFSMGKNLGAKNQAGTASLGAGIHNVFGKQFSPLIGLGLGIGIDNYRPSRGETIFPLYVDFRGYPLKNKAFYYNIGAGYGFAFKNKTRGIREANGGIMANPVIGYRSASADGTSLNLEIGYKMQKAFFLEESVRTAMDIEERDIFYQRISIKLGLMFWK